MKDYKNVLVVVVGDIHANSRVALMPSVFTLEGDEGGTIGATRIQKWIYDRWIEFWTEIYTLNKRLQWPLVTILTGELADNNKYATTELVSQNLNDQFSLALKILKPVADLSDFVIVHRGTEAHSGAASWMDERLAKDFKNVVRPNEDTASWYNWRGQIAGTRLDVAHHSGHGHGRPWTKGGDANRLAADIVYRYVEYNTAMELQGDGDRQLKLPHIVLRGHNHKPVDSIDNHPVRAIINPSWQLSTSFGYRLGGGWLPIGGMYMLCQRGKPANVVKRYWQWPREPYWFPELAEESEAVPK